MSLTYGNFWYFDRKLEQPQGTWLRFLHMDGQWFMEQFDLQSYSWSQADFEDFFKEETEQNGVVCKLLPVFDQANDTSICLLISAQELISIGINHHGVAHALKIEIMNAQVIKTPLEAYPNLEQLKYKIKKPPKAFEYGYDPEQMFEKDLSRDLIIIEREDNELLIDEVEEKEAEEIIKIIEDRTAVPILTVPVYNKKADSKETPAHISVVKKNQQKAEEMTLEQVGELLGMERGLDRPVIFQEGIFVTPETEKKFSKNVVKDKDLEQFRLNYDLFKIEYVDNLGYCVRARERIPKNTYIIYSGLLMPRKHEKIVANYYDLPSLYSFDCSELNNNLLQEDKAISLKPYFYGGIAHLIADLPNPDEVPKNQGILTANLKKVVIKLKDGIQLVALQANSDIPKDSLLGYPYDKTYWNSMEINSEIKQLYIKKDGTVISPESLSFLPRLNSNVVSSIGLFSQAKSNNFLTPAYTIHEIFEFCNIDLPEGENEPSKKQCELALRRLTVPKEGGTKNYKMLKSLCNQYPSLNIYATTSKGLNAVDLAVDYAFKSPKSWEQYKKILHFLIVEKMAQPFDLKSILDNHKNSSNYRCVRNYLVNCIAEQDLRDPEPLFWGFKNPG